MKRTVTVNKRVDFNSQDVFKCFNEEMLHNISLNTQKYPNNKVQQDIKH